jgi:hypothetical protein
MEIFAADLRCSSRRSKKNTIVEMHQRLSVKEKGSGNPEPLKQ